MYHLVIEIIQVINKVISIYLQYIFDYTTKEGKLIANVGKVIHESHQVWFKAWDIDKALIAFDEAYSRLVGVAAEGLEPKDPCQFANVRAIVEQYYLTHGADFFPFNSIEEGIERVHAAPLVDDIMFFGLIDLPVKVVFL